LINKVSLVTIWVEPKSFQIVKYTFDNVNFDFLPAAWLVRVNDLKALMTMSQPFPDVWLPRDVDMFFSAMIAIGTFDGHYRIDYVDGCMKYGGGQGWTIHAYAGGSYAWWFVGATSSEQVVQPPGTVGFSVGAGAYAEFEECVAANLLLSPVEFDFAGGKLGGLAHVDGLGHGQRNPTRLVGLPVRL
jgi:hypothetical protein